MTDDKRTSIQLYKSTKDRIEDHKILDSESYGHCLNRILDEYESEDE